MVQNEVHSQRPEFLMTRVNLSLVMKLLYIRIHKLICNDTIESRQYVWTRITLLHSCAGIFFLVAVLRTIGRRFIIHSLMLKRKRFAFNCCIFVKKKILDGDCSKFQVQSTVATQFIITNYSKINTYVCYSAHHHQIACFQGSVALFFNQFG
jgi:hypothetical protein